jgi:hypothetical protein
VLDWGMLHYVELGVLSDIELKKRKGQGVAGLILVEIRPPQRPLMSVNVRKRESI